MEPIIIDEPEAQTVLGGTSVAIGVAVTAAVSPYYQWLFNGVPITNATNGSFTLINATPSEAGTYSVIVSNSYGSVLSSNAVLTVVSAFVSTLSPNWGISDAVLAGSVSTGSNSSVVWFNWGADTNYGNSTAVYSVPNGAVSLNFSNRITGLAPYTTYHFQAVASNALGVVLGADAAFTTAPRFLLTSGTNGNWGSIAWSSDGSKIFASSGGVLYLSTNSGAAWAPFNAAGLTTYVPSADGAKLVGVNGNVLYRTTNSGASWSSNSTPTNFSTLAASADVVKLVATGGGQIYVSTNTGGLWTLTSVPRSNWVSAASSADGTEFVALAVESGNPLGFGNGYVGFVYLSTNSGLTWSDNAYFGDETHISSIACSANGAALFMAAEFSFLSSDSGLA